MDKLEHRLGLAQVLLSMIFIVGYFVVLGMFVLGYVKAPLEWKDVLSTLLSLLTAGVLMILQFWFSRSRGISSPPSVTPDSQ